VSKLWVQAFVVRYAGAMTPADMLPTIDGARADGVEAIIRSFGGLRRRDLLAETPTKERKLAALVVVAKVVRREVVEGRLTFGEVEYARAQQGMPAAGDYDVDGTTLVIREVGERTTCPDCAMQPGSMSCAVCGGSGDVEDPYPYPYANRARVNLGPRMLPCTACGATGTVTCASCGGSARALEVLAARVSDRGAEVDHIYGPELSLTELDELRALGAGELPAALSVNLEPRREGGAYRDAPARYALHGHDYEAAIALARGALAGLGGASEVAKQETSIHAWPYLRLTYKGGKRMALLRDAAGRHHALTPWG